MDKEVVVSVCTENDSPPSGASELKLVNAIAGGDEDPGFSSSCPCSSVSSTSCIRRFCPAFCVTFILNLVTFSFWVDV